MELEEFTAIPPGGLVQAALAQALLVLRRSPELRFETMVLGVTCSAKAALLTAVEDGEVVVAPVYRVEVAAINEASAELEATLDEIGRALLQIKPELVVLLLPEQSPHFKQTYVQLAPRVALETLVRLACVRAGIPIEVMRRVTVRAKLELPKRGDLAAHAAERIGTGPGPYWSAGRNVAALAALAGEAR